MTDKTSSVFVKNSEFVDDSKSRGISDGNDIGTQLTVICDNFRINMTSSLELSPIHNSSSMAIAVSSNFIDDSGLYDDSKTSNISEIGHDIGTKLAVMCDDFDAKMMSYSKFSPLEDSNAKKTATSSVFVKHSGFLDYSKTSNIGHSIGVKLAAFCIDFDDKMMDYSDCLPTYDSDMTKIAVSPDFIDDSGFFDDTRTCINSGIGYDIGTKLAVMCDDFNAEMVSYTEHLPIQNSDNTAMPSSLDITPAYSVFDNSTSSNIINVGYDIGTKLAVMCDNSNAKTKPSTARSLLKNLFDSALNIFEF